MKNLKHDKKAKIELLDTNNKEAPAHPNQNRTYQPNTLCHNTNLKRGWGRKIVGTEDRWLI